MFAKAITFLFPLQSDGGVVSAEERQRCLIFTLENCKRRLIIASRWLERNSQEFKTQQIVTRNKFKFKFKFQKKRNWCYVTFEHPFEKTYFVNLQRNHFQKKSLINGKKNADGKAVRE